MARDARFAHLFAMIGDEHRIFFLVTLDACGADIRRFDLLVLPKRMTRTTCQRGLIVVALMIDQGKAKLIVRENIGRGTGEIGSTPFMIDMTCSTIGRVAQDSVNALRLRDLIAHVIVTLDALLCVGSVKRRVTQITARFEIGMRNKILNRSRLRMIGGKRARRKWRTACDRDNG